MKPITDLIVAEIKKDLPNYPVGRRFLTLREAMDKYHVSNLPIQRAYKYLSAMGYLEQSKRGAPYLVRKHP
jgi:DNA-binding transcriptional regulator YhcF (GntR family)